MTTCLGKITRSLLDCVTKKNGLRKLAFSKTIINQKNVASIATAIAANKESLADFAISDCALVAKGKLNRFDTNCCGTAGVQ